MLIFGLLSAFFLVASLSAVVLINPQGKHTSFSVHAASKTWSYILFGSALSICGTAFVFFMLKLGTHIQAPLFYYIAVALGWIFTVLTAWIPDKTGEPTFHNPHWVVAYGLGLMMTAIVGSLCFARDVSVALKMSALITSCWYLFSLYLGVFVSSGRRHFL